ncbi:DUF1566 domain-containing protein [Methylomonas sp. AM2-LC]|uniref:Lcl C-terminal domain-containing protein n=1 Tax=Methylomonas sp. AM2-LC TaxID=3153301 RepID=UPI003266365F
MLQGKTLLAASLLFGLASFNAQATLTSETVNGQNLVYDSGNNTTWTQDANLLGTWEGAYQSTSYTNIVTAIINASGGVIHDTPNYYDGSLNNYDGANGRAYSGTYTLTTADFGSGGTVDWWAGQALVHYLDTQNYGGSNQWALPTSNPVFGYDNGSQLGELFYNELGGTAGSSIPSGPFSNVQAYVYWSGTEYAAYPGYAWYFYTVYGYQNLSYKDFQFYAWAVSPGQVNAVPVPGAVWLFGTGMLGLLGLKRRGHAG